MGGTRQLTCKALFMSQAQLDDTRLVNTDKTVKDDAAAGKSQYGVCHQLSWCEGAIASLVREPEFVGHLAADNPLGVHHKGALRPARHSLPPRSPARWTQRDVVAPAHWLTPSLYPQANGQRWRLTVRQEWWAVIRGGQADNRSTAVADPDDQHPHYFEHWRCGSATAGSYKGVDGAYDRLAHDRLQGV